jgi:hypothetical protein
MVEIDHILPVSAEGSPNMIDAEHEEQGQPENIVVCHSSQLTTVSC